jgi:hypothetical protein
MDYWALGHIHARETVMLDPPAEYPGSPQGLDPSETGPHGCLVVEVREGDVLREFVETDSVRWIAAEVDVSECGSLGDVRDAVLSTVLDAGKDCGDLPSIARVRLTGRSTAHRDLSVAGALSDLLDDVREQSMGREPWVWVDRLESSAGPLLDIEALRAQEGFVGDLVRMATSHEQDAEGAVERARSQVAARGVDLPEGEVPPEELVRRARDLCLDLLARDET